MEDNRLENTYKSSNLLVRTYFRYKINQAIRLARLKKSDVILDFGCGGGWLEQKLQRYTIYGYDANPKKTFIKDYRTIKPTKIFALDVFEHIPKYELQKIIDSLKKLNVRFEIIISIPTENFLSRKVRKLVGKEEIPKEHVTKYKDILELLQRNFTFKRKSNIFTVTHTFVFEHPKINVTSIK